MDSKIRLRKTYISALTRPQSSPSLSLLLSYLLGKCLGYARGEDRKARGGGRSLPSPFFRPVIPFVKEPVLVLHNKY